MATTLFNACCGNFGDFGSSKIESSFFWQLLALARVVLFWPPCYFSPISMSRPTCCHCITLQISVRRRFSSGVVTMHRACLRMRCSAEQCSRDWWSIDGGRREKITPKISLRWWCRARGQGDRGGTRSLAGGMNWDLRKISVTGEMGFEKDFGQRRNGFLRETLENTKCSLRYTGVEGCVPSPNHMISVMREDIHRKNHLLWGIAEIRYTTLSSFFGRQNDVLRIWQKKVT